MNNKITVSLIINSREAKMGMPFGSIIGQYGINIKEFCDKFNKISEKVLEGIPLRINVLIYKNRDFDIIIKGFDINFFIEFYLIKKDYLISKEVYSIYLLQKKLNEIYFKKEYINDFSNLRNLFNYLKTSKVKCIY